MKFKPLLIAFVAVLLFIYSISSVNASWYDWFSKDSKESSQPASVDTKRENLLKLLEIIDTKSQVQNQINITLTVVESPINQLISTVKHDLPQGKQASDIIFNNYEGFKKDLITSIDYDQVYYSVYDRALNNQEVIELIQFFKTPVGQKFIKNNSAITMQIALQVQKQIVDKISQELPKLNKEIMRDFVESDYMDKMIDKFKNDLKFELKELLKE